MSKVLTNSQGKIFTSSGDALLDRGGIVSSGNINITNTNQTDVTNYATAQVVDTNLTAENIADGVNVLGITGTYKGLISSAVSLNGLFSFTNSSYVTSSTPRPTLPETLYIEAPYCSAINNMFYTYIPHAQYSMGNPVNLILKIGEYNNYIFQANYFLYRNITVKTVTFLGGCKLTSTHYNFIGESNTVESIYGTIDFDEYSHLGSYNTTSAFAAGKLKDITFAHNCLHFNYTFTSPYLTDASLVSIANGLDPDHTNTLTLESTTTKPRTTTLTGTVALDSTGTYYVFTQDDTGTTTLEDFITNTKGWTLA